MHTKKLEEAVNGSINDVLTAMLGFGNGIDGLVEDIPEQQKDAARLVAGILTAAKVSIMQAGATINEMGLDDA